MRTDFAIGDVFCHRVATLCEGRNRINWGGVSMPKDAQ